MANKQTPQKTVQTNKLAPKAAPPQKHHVRSFFSFVLFGWALFLILVLNLSFWVSRTVLDTNVFVATTAPLIKQPQIQKKVGDSFADQILKSGQPQEVVDKLSPSIPGLTVENAKVKISDSVVGVLSTASFQQTWESTIRTAHTKAVALLKDNSPNPTVDVSSLFTTVQTSLKGTALAPVADIDLPKDAGIIKLNDTTQLDKIQNGVKQTQMGEIGIAVFIFVLIAGATLLAVRRLRALGIFLVILSATMFLAVLTFAQGGSFAIGKMPADNAVIARSIFVVIRKPLLTQSIILASVSAVAGAALIVVNSVTRKKA